MTHTRMSTIKSYEYLLSCGFSLHGSVWNFGRVAFKPRYCGLPGTDDGIGCMQEKVAVEEKEIMKGEKEKSMKGRKEVSGKEKQLGGGP